MSDVFDEILHGDNDDKPTSIYDLDLLAQIVNWAEFWASDSDEEQWMAEPVIALGRAHAIYAPGGTGKSLFSLWIAAALATGRQGLDGEPLTRRRVLYLDYEMTHADVLERLRSMGYDETCDLSWLHYAILPTLPPADAPEGGKAIARMAQLVNADLVVLDTFSRAVSGDENDADTVRSFYRWTLLHLKSDGRTFVRIDHAGKDVEKGQRGSSAKNDDVDVVWQMVKAEGGFKLTAKKARMGWVEPTLALQQFDSPSLHYKAVGFVAPAGTDRIVADLNDLGVATDATTRVAAQALKDAGRGARMELVRAAQKRRVQTTVSDLFGVGTHCGTHTSAGPSGPTPDPQPVNADLPGTDPLRDPRDPGSPSSGSRGPLPSRDPGPGPSLTTLSDGTTYNLDEPWT